MYFIHFLAKNRNRIRIYLYSRIQTLRIRTSVLSDPTYVDPNICTLGSVSKVCGSAAHNYTKAVTITFYFF